MLKLVLPKNSTPVDGLSYRSPDCSGESKNITLRVYRRNSLSHRPRIDSYVIPFRSSWTLLQALDYIKSFVDPTLSYRKSCREGACGSCSMNINKRNGLACTAKLADLGSEVEVYPLPHMKTVKDLVCDMSDFYRKYESTKPWIVVEDQKSAYTKFDDSLLEGEILQSKKQRAQLDGLYECVMCGCCSTQCPSYWWNETEFLGPAAMLSVLRFVQDSRDVDKNVRLAAVARDGGIDHCQSIFSCTTGCPKGLNPAQAIARLKSLLKK